MIAAFTYNKANCRQSLATCLSCETYFSCGTRIENLVLLLVIRLVDEFVGGRKVRVVFDLDEDFVVVIDETATQMNDRSSNWSSKDKVRR